MKDPAVIAFIDALEPTLKKQVEAIRKAILSVSPEIEEGIKWKVPSFRTVEYFATFHLRGEGVKLILHTGAKVKKSKGLKLEDPLLEWLGTDRAMITFADAKDVKAKLPDLKRLIAEWLKRL